MDPTYRGLRPPTPNKIKSAASLKLNRWVMIGGVAAIGIILLGVLVSLLTPNTASITQRLMYRIDSLYTLTVSARSNIQDDSLSKINTDLSIILSGDNAALKKATPAVSMTKELTAVKTEETDAATTDKLKTAKVNGGYDTLYKTVLIQKIEAAVSLMNEVSSKTSNSNLKSVIATIFTHLNTYYQQLKQLN